MYTPYFQFSGGILGALLFLAALFFLLVFLPVSIVAEAFSRLGLTTFQGVLMFLAIVVGRGVDIPVFTSQRLVMVRRPRVVTCVLDRGNRPSCLDEEPANELKKQIFAVNVGGFVLPLLLSLTFVLGTAQGAAAQGWGYIGFALVVVAVGCYAIARPHPLTGLRVPLLMPALMTFVSVYFFVPEPIRPLAAYVAGTMGTILGGNLAPLLTPRIRNRIGTPLVSIGGAGTFGGVLVAGVLAVLLA